MTASSPVASPHFLAGPAGPLFGLYVHKEPVETAGAVLYLPAFGEEMNRSRRMASLFARAAAEAGFAVLVLDVFGTGDSAGSFAEASWDVWLRDGAAGVDWLAARGHDRVYAVGLRTGANLARATAAGSPTPVQGLILWQPVLRGDLFLNQLLRVRVAGSLGPADGGTKETTGSLKARLREGETLEVAGYPISPLLADQIGQLLFANPEARSGCPLSWIELVAEPSDEPSPATAAALKVLRDGESPIRYDRLKGEPFWSIEEPVLNHDLIDFSVARLRDMAT